MFQDHLKFHPVCLKTFAYWPPQPVKQVVINAVFVHTDFRGTQKHILIYNLRMASAVIVLVLEKLSCSHAPTDYSVVRVRCASERLQNSARRRIWFFVGRDLAAEARPLANFRASS